MKARFLYRSDGLTCAILPESKNRAIKWLEAIPEGTRIRVSIPGFSSVGKKGWSVLHQSVEHDSENSKNLKEAGLAQRGLFAVEAEVLP